MNPPSLSVEVLGGAFSAAEQRADEDTANTRAHTGA